MKGYIDNIEKITKENTDFRRVLYTAKQCQLVVMSLLPGEEIGMEVHGLDQFIRIEAGSGVAILDGMKTSIEDGSAIIVPAGVEHNIVNTGAIEDLKLYTLYAPPNHKDGIIHTTKAAAEADTNDHFDGVTTHI